MKKLLLLLFSILIMPISVNASDVYYCSDDGIVGFSVENGYKIKTYNEQKFKIMIDFAKNVVISKELLLTSDNQECFYNFIGDTLYCMNQVGWTFSINKPDLKYHRSSIYNKQDQTDDIFVAYGTCEKF